MQDFIEANWLALFTLAIALLGGIRGVIDIANELRSHARMTAILTRLTPITVAEPDGRPFVCLILNLVAGNKGKNALIPILWKLECKIGPHWIPFDHTTMPEGFHVNLSGAVKRFDDVKLSDIAQFTHVIKQDSPAVGFLCFSSTTVSYDRLNAEFKTMPIRLACLDLFNKTHKFKLNSNLV